MSDQRIYLNQALTIEADVEVDITGATAWKIKAKSPTGEEYEWDATDVTESGDLGVISTDIPNSVLNEAGIWAFWAKVTFSDATWIDGTPHDEEIFNLGSK